MDYKDIFKKKPFNTLIQNYFALSLLQLSNYVLPLITLPYLTRVLGPEKFGLIAFAQAITQYLMLITEFGFNISATKNISIYRDNNKKITEIFSSVMIIKILILSIIFILFIILFQISDEFNSERTLYIYFFLGVIGWALFPQWLFQGLEKMKFVSFFNILSKLIFTVSIFFFINSVEDYELVALIQSLGFVFSGIISLLVAVNLANIKFVIPTKTEIIKHFKDSLVIFWSTISTNLYTSSNSIILGILTNNIIVGYYSAAEKIIKAILFFSMPLQQSLFPFMSKQFMENRGKAIKILRLILYVIGSLAVVIAILLSLFANSIVNLLLGVDYKESVIIFNILSWIIPFGIINYTLGIQGLVNLGYEKAFSKVVFIGGFIHIVILFLTIPKFGVLVVPIQWLLTELIILILIIKKMINVLKISSMNS
ncbi:MAG: flippase [Ignavibacteria bacterium]|nr:flippase [Ignavibacteria bacterium]MDH7527396.1 flippase [Ignavibacteria bacterium]